MVHGLTMDPAALLRRLAPNGVGCWFSLSLGAEQGAHCLGPMFVEFHGKEINSLFARTCFLLVPRNTGGQQRRTTFCVI